ncbi:MAG: hypothetical protein KJ064_03195 [Anaerolineae bacterium]|nr:hypothetical protein [Anaerolineae bacterium]
MGSRRWNTTQEMSTIHLTQVFSGGACNILDAEGNLLRNKERDAINDWLTQHNIMLYDPQIHPETHGVEYNYPQHYHLEKAARGAAKIDLYEISPRTFGGITSLEIAADHFVEREPMVIYFSDGDPEKDQIPAHSSKGHPLFVPDALMENDKAMKAHYKEFIKNANNMRRHMINFAREVTMITVTFGTHASRSDIVISPERMHAADLFRAVMRGCSGQRTIINFTGGERIRDSYGYPQMLVPENPPELVMKSLLDQYLDEGNALRRAIAELVEISVFVRVVYTQKSAILALEELLKIKGLLSE